MAEVKKELKPCPFCGGKIKLDEDDFYMFCCDKCGAGITFAKELEDGTATDCNKKESIEKWNRRAYDPDKVMKQLEDYSNADEAERLGTIPVIELDDALKIVKGGGVDA